MMNPELRRNLWLEITPHRLLAMPAVLVLAFLALSAIDRDTAMATVSMTALGGFGLLTILWGTRLAANSVMDEMIDKTWDWQRLSILTPWEMTWGKLFGATAFAWYGGLVCMAVFLSLSHATPVTSPVKTALTAILLAVMLHAAAIASALHMSRKGGAQHRRSAGFLVLIAVLYIVPYTLSRGWESKLPVNWFGIDFDSGSFILASAAVFAAWAVAGAWRAMCQALAVRTTPAMWAAFLVFVSIYAAGFAIGEAKISLAQAILFSGLVWSVGLTYLMLFTEPTGPLVVRRVMRKTDLGQWHRAAEEMPCWPVTLAIAALCAVPLAALNAGSSWMPTGWAMAPIPLVLMLARDAGILMFFLAAPKPKRAEGTTLVYIVVLDWILPGVLHAMNLDVLARLILPLGEGNTWLQIAVALIQAGVVWWFAWQRINERISSTRAADGG